MKDIILQYVEGVALVALVLSIVVIYGVVEAVKRSDKIDNSYLPLVSGGVGLVIGVVIAVIFFAIGEITVLQAVLIGSFGLVSGLGTSGLYDSIASFLYKKEDM